MMRFLSNFLALFFRNLIDSSVDSTRIDTPRILGGGEFWRNEVIDSNADLARSENHFAGEFNHRTGRFDAGNDPTGWYDSDE